MAESRDTKASRKAVSIHGRQLYLDYNDFLGGPKDLPVHVTNATSDTTGTNLTNYGVHTVESTTDDGWVLDDPEPGVSVIIVTSSAASTGNHAITFAGATCISTNGTAGSSITMVDVGAYIKLTGISTSKWVVTSIPDSTAATATVVVSS